MTPVLQTAVGLAIPFVGTALGAAAVFLFKSNIPPRVQKILLGFASGVMLAASVWSLLLPALELSGSWLPVVVGFLVGIGFLLGLDQLTARLHLEPKPGTAGANSFLLVLAVTLHNVPEGMAVGVAFAGMLAGDGAITPADAFALAVGIALQNIPEGTIVAAPQAAGMHRWCPWRTSTCTSQAIFTPSARPTTCWRRCWTTTSSRVTPWGSTSSGLRGGGVWI